MYVEKPEIDEKTKREYELLSFTPSDKTLIRNIKQIRAGELIVYNKLTGVLDRQFHYRYGYYRTVSIADLSDEDKLRILDERNIKAFRRAVTFLNGRTAVISLSAGQDSRVVAVMLKRLGYENVVTFTYGKAGNIEVEKAKQVAAALGYKWYFMENIGDDWQSVIQDGIADDYFRYASDYNTIAHIANFFSLKKLKADGIIPEDSVCFFGGINDTICGTKFPKDYIWKKTESARRWRQLASDQFLSLCRCSRKERNAIAKDLWPDIPSRMSIEDALDLRYRWYFPERGIKFFINTVRSYEFFGFQWYNPLHDMELYDFWFKLDMKDYYGRRLQYEYNNKYMAKYTGIIEKVPTIHYSIKTMLKGNYFARILFKGYRKVVKKSVSQIRSEDPLGYFDCFTDKQIKEMYREYGSGLNGNSINIHHYLAILCKQVRS